MKESLTYEEVVKIAVAETIKTMEAKWDEREKKVQDNRRHNTKLLLKNYRLFKKHQDSSIHALAQLEDSTVEFMALMSATGDNIYKGTKVEAICNTRANTTIMLAHLDEMIGVYRHLCEKSAKPEDMRRYRILEARYISDDELTTEEIAELEAIDTRTVFKDLKIVYAKLSVLLFGVDCLK